jgi:broad specificity phosphatase PhoE
MRIHILRHGETEFNKLGIIQGSSVNTSLNETGRMQARAFHDFYQHIDFELVVTSALKRTHETVQHFIDKGLPWHITPDINEISWGENEGKPISPEWNKIWVEVRDSWISGDLNARLPGGESAAELNARLERFIAWLKTREEKQILVCAHGRTMRGLISLLKGITLADMEGFPHANTGCYVADYRNGAFHFLAENSVKHLENILI